jgi:hypothetical protein
MRKVPRTCAYYLPILLREGTTALSRAEINWYP